MRASLAFAALLAATLSGCLGGAAEERTGQTAVAAGPDASVETTPLETGPPIVAPSVDLWEGRTEILLFDDVLDVKECYGAENQFWITFYNLVYAQRARFGCAEGTLPEGVILPEGTASLVVEADASGAHRVGKWFTYAWTYGGNWYDGEETSGAEGRWSLAVTPGDWDLPMYRESALWFGVWPGRGGADALYGPVELRITAVRDPAWTPLPTLDHWKMPDRHAMPQDGVITVLDASLRWKQPSHRDCFDGCEWPETPAPTDVIPGGTKQLALVLAWDRMEGCPSEGACGFGASVHAGRWTGTWDADATVERGDGHVIAIFDVPADARVDGPYVERSGASVEAWLAAPETVCDATGVCMEDQAYAADLRVVVEAWDHPVDIAALKARMGIA